MKRIPFFLITMALALFIVNGCEREDFSNPNYDPETQTVMTNLVFNISTATAKTKQSADATQATTTSPFLGINQSVLLTYVLPNPGKILAADATSPKAFDLAELASAGTLSSTESRRVIEMSLPLNTNTLLFYGRAIPGNTYGNYTVDECYGHLDTYQMSESSGSGLFTLGKQLQDEEKSKFYAAEKLFAGIFSLIMNTNLIGSNHVAISGAAAPTGVTNTYKFDVSTEQYPELDWATYGNATNSPVETGHSLYPLEVKLKTAYNQMTTINSEGGELRAGSGEAIIRTIQDLWTVVNEVRCTEPLNQAEAVAKFLANSIFIRINKYFYAASLPGDGAPITNVSFQTMSNPSDNNGIIEMFQSAAEVAAQPDVSGQTYTDVWPSASELSSIAGVVPANFPFNFNLPRGASHMAFDKTRKIFYYPATFNTSGMGGVMEGGQFNAESYFYPAELLYFGNSPIRTSDKDRKVSDYPQGSGTGSGQWSAEASWDSGIWTGQAVKASTRSVAMKYNINYGTALLSSQVQYGVGTLKDNNRVVQAELQGLDPSNLPSTFTEQDNEIAVNATSFKFTGIIVGGQSQNVGWDFLPVATGSTPKYTYGFVYDRAVPEAAQSIPVSGASQPNYTMLFDNFKGTGQTDGIWNADTQDPVYVALEFQNNSGRDFYGNHNLIQDGGYFYLIAELNPENATGTAPVWPTNYVLPPYKADGTSNQVTRVFMQDYMTSAVFTLGVNSLKHAYLTVPDLRAGSMTLGLSVDVNWSTGLSFDDVILGGN